MMQPESLSHLDQILNDKITDYSQIGRHAGKKDITEGKNLDNLMGISIGLASKEEVRELSYGEVLISETINYRTQRPERGGLFCEQIFGPRKNYECACGKYKRIRYKGVICERCGVEVTTAQVRRQRTGHIELAAPVVHIWYLKSVPSRIGLLLDISIKKLEQVVYFASYIVTDVYEEKREEAMRELDNAYKSQKVELQKQIQQAMNDARFQLEAKEISKRAYADMETAVTSQLDTLEEEYAKLRDLLKAIAPAVVIGELDYRLLYEKFPHVFKGGTGAEHIRTLLGRIDLKQFIDENQEELKVSPKSKHKKILQRLKLASNLYKSGQRPENFVLEALQVIPPDLRPMIQLDGGRYASSDLNDLYRRVINRNNRLRKLSELGAPEVILKNEKRMLQESVDILISGEVRSNRAGYTTATRKKLKSLADILKGKQGRFRQNLLGKRVDYSGRSVIVVGPKLKMNECGLPKMMALVLFKPFIIGELIEREVAFSVKQADKVIEERGKEVWDALEAVIKDKYVLLNRAPTLHRLGIQAFKPVLIEGKAIQLHPLSCTAFNADFDGDQMAVHLPLTLEAQAEARELMVTSRNMLNPSNGEPIVAPEKDMILGCYYLTFMEPGEAKYVFSSKEDAAHAYDNNVIVFHTPIRVRIGSEIVTTTYGRMLFNEIVPPELGYVNETQTKKALKNLLAKSFSELGSEETAYLSDRIKNLGFQYATLSGLTISKEDMIIPGSKSEHTRAGEEKIKQIQKRFWNGYLTENERYVQSLDVWNKTKRLIEEDMKKNFNFRNPIYQMIDSGARGNWGNISQLSGMMGLVASPSGKIIELPIKSNLKEGFSTLEYFIATHGGRKGKADTALKTAQSGYLTRRLVDAAQNVLVREDDCGTHQLQEVSRETSQALFNESFDQKIYGKTLARDVEVEGKILFHAGETVTRSVLDELNARKVSTVSIRSILTCETEDGVCQRCYGLDLGYNQEVTLGTPVGIIAAQSIGEPGTQLTMRTFHSGGAAKEGGDITQGLTRVEELFEARAPKYQAIIADCDGTITSVTYQGQDMRIVLEANSLEHREYYLPDDTYDVGVKKGDRVHERTVLARSREAKANKVVAAREGIVEKISDGVIVVKDVEAQVFEYSIDTSRSPLKGEGEVVSKGDKLTEGHINLQQLMDLAGPLVTQSYIVNEIKAIYASQGQTVNSKHVELIVRQMFSKVKITSAGDTSFFPGDIVDIISFKHENDKATQNGGAAAIGSRLLLGITKISLFTDSWLSSASFQETVRILVEASTARKIDKLSGLKENVIIGRLIPTLRYFENNRNVGEYFDFESAADSDSYASIRSLERDDSEYRFETTDVSETSENASAPLESSLSE